MSKDFKTNPQKSKKEQWELLLQVTELFRRYLSGESTENEKKSIDSWIPIENEKGLLKDRNLAKKCNTDIVWEKIAKELNLDSPSLDSSKTHVYKRTIQRILATAAVFLVLIGGSLFFHFSQTSIENSQNQNTAQVKKYFSTSDAQIKKITLLDGSQITLNRGSKLYYLRKKYNKQKREVWLEGEAFFNVTKNPEKPFIIHTGNIYTTVLGTSFNIKAYPQLEENIVTVRDGKVDICSKNLRIGLLTKNMQLTYNSVTNKSEIADVNWENASGWIDGRLVLNNATVSELQLRIKQFFGVNVEIKDNVLENAQLINSSFDKSSSIDDVMTAISLLYNVRYSCETPNKVLIYK